MLNENLLDSSSDLDLPSTPPSGTPASYPSEEELDESLKKLNIECRSETPEARRKRLACQEKIDRWTLVGYAGVVATSLISSVVAMASSALGILELAFAMPLFTGPFVIHQKDGLIKCRKKREIIADTRMLTKRMNQVNLELKYELDLIQKEVDRLKVSERELEFLVEKQGHDVQVFKALVRENKKINAHKKHMAEAIAFQNLITSVVNTDKNGDHFIGDAELNLLAYRLEQIEGVPFTGQEMCDRFSRVKVRHLTNLVDVVRILYVEKRREQEMARTRKELDKSPKKLGAHLLWKRKMEYGGVTV